MKEKEGRKEGRTEGRKEGGREGKQERKEGMKEGRNIDTLIWDRVAALLFLFGSNPISAYAGVKSIVNQLV